MLRVKPKFLNFSIEIKPLEKAAKSMKEYRPSQRAPEKLHFLAGIQDVYTFNFAMAFVSFLIVLLLRGMIGFMKEEDACLVGIYKFLFNRSLGITLFASLVEPNLTIISFYGMVQFQHFFAVDFFGKAHLVAAVLLTFVVLLYATSFYYLIFHFEPREISEDLLNVSIFGRKSIYLEALFNCIRSVFHGFIHALLLTSNVPAMAGLIILDLLLVVASIIARKRFLLTLLFLSTVLYSVIFVCFDIVVLCWKFDLLSTVTFDYGLHFVLMIFSLLAIVVVKWLLLIFLLIKDIVRYFRKKN